MYGVSVDLDSILPLMENFKVLTGINIAFYTIHLESYRSPGSSACEFCSILRTDPQAEVKCRSCDAHAFKTASSTGRLYLYECHAGLTEAVAPLILDGKLLGYLMMGQTLAEAPSRELWNKMKQRNGNYRIDHTALEKAFFRLHYQSWEKIRAAAEILDMSAKYIYLSGLAAVKEPLLLHKLKNIIESNLEKDISIADVAKSLNISRSHLSHLIKERLHVSFTSYLLSRRIEKALRLLTESTEKIHLIARQCGFPDQNYFSRVFRKAKGVTPSQYRKISQNKADLC